MLKPLFDKNSNLVAWLEPDKHIFDTGMNWIAFIAKGHIWSADDVSWLGPIIDDNCMDRQGRVFMWNNRSALRGCIRPITPTRPIKASRPYRPLRPTTPTRPTLPIRPLHGWSPFSMREWLRQ